MSQTELDEPDKLKERECRSNENENEQPPKAVELNTGRKTKMPCSVRCK